MKEMTKILKYFLKNSLSVRWAIKINLHFWKFQALSLVDLDRQYQEEDRSVEHEYEMDHEEDFGNHDTSADNDETILEEDDPRSASDQLLLDLHAQINSELNYINDGALFNSDFDGSYSYDTDINNEDEE